MSTDLALPQSFFAPVPKSEIQSLMREYQAEAEIVSRIAGIFIDPACRKAMDYFQQGNKDCGGRHGPSPDRLFRLDPAMKALDAAYWRKAIDLTDIYDVMPSARRTEWNDSITKMKTPAFTAENVFSTFESLFAGRGQFFAERVDNIFHGLSGSHVTNSPAGFRKRMILNYVFEGYSMYAGRKAEIIDDLRKVIAKFLGNDDPHYASTRKILGICRRNHGEWHTIDGGALRIRCYLKGTAHLEVHPDMAWRLNAVLHTLYPSAIPPKERKRDPKPKKHITPIQRPLPAEVVAIFAGMNVKGTSATFGHYGLPDKHVLAEAWRVLTMIGGTRCEGGVEFAYPAASVIDDIATSGCIPDAVSHQYYPTPADVADAAMQMVDWSRVASVLEPSAGTGALADVIASEQEGMVALDCIDTSELFVRILREKGHAAECANFLNMAPAQRYDAIVMNPPYDRGQWLEHVKHALQFLADDGQLVAILPASQRGKELLPSYTHTWSEVYENRFANTSMDVSVLKLEAA